MKLFKFVKWALLIIVLAAMVLFAVAMVNRAKQDEAIYDAKTVDLTQFGDVNMEEVMDSVCDDVVWNNVEVLDDITYVDVSGKLKEGLPLMEKYAGEEIGFTAQLKYDEEGNVDSLTLVDATLGGNELDIDYDLDWIVSMIYFAYNHFGVSEPKL